MCVGEKAGNVAQWHSTPGFTPEATAPLPEEGEEEENSGVGQSGELQEGRVSGASGANEHGGDPSTHEPRLMPRTAEITQKSN